MAHEDPNDEPAYDRLRLSQSRNGQARGEGLSRRDLLRLSTGAGVAAGRPGRGTSRPGRSPSRCRRSCSIFKDPTPRCVGGQ
jgi:hypothetical protein